MTGPETWRFVARFQFPPIVQGPHNKARAAVPTVARVCSRSSCILVRNACRFWAGIPVHRLMGRSPLRGGIQCGGLLGPDAQIGFQRGETRDGIAPNVPPSRVNTSSNRIFLGGPPRHRDRSPMAAARISGAIGRAKSRRVSFATLPGWTVPATEDRPVRSASVLASIPNSSRLSCKSPGSRRTAGERRQ